MSATQWAAKHLKGWDDESRAAFVPLVEELNGAGRHAVAVEIAHLMNGQSTMEAVYLLVENLQTLPPESVEGFLQTRHGMTAGQQRSWAKEIATVPAACIVAYRSVAAGMEPAMRQRLRHALHQSAEPALLLQAAGHIADAHDRVAWAERAVGLDARGLRRNVMALKNLTGTPQVIASRNDPAAIAALPNYGLESYAPELELQMRLALLSKALGPIVDDEPTLAARLVTADWPVGVVVSTRANVEHIPDLMTVFTHSQDPFTAMVVRAGLFLPSDDSSLRTLPAREIPRAAQLVDLAASIPDDVRPMLVEWRGALSSVLRQDGGIELDALGLVEAVGACTPGSRGLTGWDGHGSVRAGQAVMREVSAEHHDAEASRRATAALAELRSAPAWLQPDPLTPGMRRAIDRAAAAFVARAGAARAAKDTPVQGR